MTDGSPTKIYVQDVTLRDGMHAIRHQYGLEHVHDIAKAIDDAGCDAIEVAHGDGIAGSSFNYGFGAHTDWEWLEEVASVLTTCVLTTLVLPGIATIDDLKRANDIGVKSVRIATHCTEADIAIQHIGMARDLGMDVAGFLMMSHMNEPAALAEQAKAALYRLVAARQVADLMESPDPPKPANGIDKVVFAKLKSLGIEPALCSDAVFIRRAYLDLTGKLPPAEEAKAFIQDSDQNKRVTLIERLLQEPAHFHYWAMKWSDILRV